MATFNPPAELLAGQIESIRAQTDGDWVCLIGDDGSEPASWAAITEAVGGDPRFEVERNPERVGVYRNFERLLGRVPPGVELVALADQDDRWEPDKLAALQARLGEGTTLAYSDMRVVDAAGEIVSPTFWTARRNNSDDLGTLLISNSITGAASLFRRRLLDQALPFPDPGDWLMHDHWIALVAMSLGEVAYVDRPLYDYLQHPGAALGHEALRGAGAGAGAEPLSARMRRGHGAVIAVRDSAATLQARGGEAVPPAKRRVLERFARIERSPATWTWLAWAWLRSLPAGTKTIGAERYLLGGLLWKLLSGLRRRAPQPGR